MALDTAQLLELEEGIIKEMPDKITHALSKANRFGKIEELLELLQMSNLLQPTSSFQSYREGKIIVIGGSEVKEDVLLVIARGLGLDKERFEFLLDYDKAQTYNYHRLQYAPTYRAVLFGPIPHSSTGKNDSSSVIAEMENKDGYPRVVRLQNCSSLKITKNSFKEALKLLISENYI